MHDRECGSSHAGLFLGGMIFGIAAGAATMFLMAPRSGKASRKMIVNRLDEIKEYATDSAEEVKMRVMDIFGEVNNITTSLYNDARKLWVKQVKTLNDSWDRIDKDKYGEMIENVMDSLKMNKKYSDSELNKIKKYLNTEVKRLIAVS